MKSTNRNDAKVAETNVEFSLNPKSDIEPQIAQALTQILKN
jgi:hypothetical protein